MNKIIAVGIGILLFSSLSVNAFADVIPEDSHSVTSCSKIVNIDDYPDVTFVGYTSGIFSDGEVYEITSDKCLSKGYQVNSLRIYALPKDYTDDVGIENVNYLTDLTILASSSEDFDVGGFYIEDDNPLSSRYIELLVAGFTDNGVVIYKSKEVSSYNNGDPDDIEYFDEPDVLEMTDNIFDFVSENIPFFKDVPEDHENYDAIQYVKKNGIVSGYSDDTYWPDSLINRAEFTKIITESLFEDYEISSCIENNLDSGETYLFLTDVPVDQWFAKYVCVATINGIIDGYPDNTFKPANLINFVEAAKIVSIATGLSGSSKRVSDEWYASYVAKMTHARAIPMSITSYEQELTRAEVAEIMYRRLNYLYHSVEYQVPTPDWD